MSDYSAHEVPALFGLKRSNRDFSNSASWGKNQFNSSFPAALCCYLSSRNIDANYLQFSDGKFDIGEISIGTLFGTSPLSDETYFSFETTFSQYDQYAIGKNPRTDLVISTTGSNPLQTAAFEVKLTAIPDSTTSNGSEKAYGAELVVRPDTIFYLVAGMAHDNGLLLTKHFANSPITMADWSDPEEALATYALIHASLCEFLNDKEIRQHPSIIQPIWKTIGRSPKLAENCLDVFAWSTTGFLYFLLENGLDEGNHKITRYMRTVIWTYSMLLDISKNGQTNFQQTIDRLSYNTKNDKAFAAPGTRTRRFMEHTNLSKPRVTKSEIKEIILGGGQNLLSPERRFDAAIVNSPELF